MRPITIDDLKKANDTYYRVGVATSNARIEQLRTAVGEILLAKLLRVYDHSTGDVACVLCGRGVDTFSTDVETARRHASECVVCLQIGEAFDEAKKL